MAQDLSGKKTNFISNCAAASVAFLSAYTALRQLRQEYTDMGYSFVQSDFQGTNVYMTPNIVVNLMSTFDFLEQCINSNATNLTGSTGYLTNLYSLKP